MNIGEDGQVNREFGGPIRVMRIIARMNVGGPAVQVSGLMRGFNATEFHQRLYTGFCANDEADYLETVATDVKSIRLEGFWLIASARSSSRPDFSPSMIR